MDEMRDDVLEYILDEYVDEDDDVEVGFDTALISSGIVDSFSMVSLKVFLEKKYNITFADGEATSEAFNTVNSVVELISRHLG